MKLPSTLRFVHPNLKETFYRLETGDNSERELFMVINRAMDDLEANAFCGIQIPKRLIPKEYFKKYDVDNLWKYNLPRGWRLIYSITRADTLVVTLILEWLNHTEYERTFNY